MKCLQVSAILLAYFPAPVSLLPCQRPCCRKTGLSLSNLKKKDQNVQMTVLRVVVQLAPHLPFVLGAQPQLLYNVKICGADKHHLKANLTPDLRPEVPAVSCPI